MLEKKRKKYEKPFLCKNQYTFETINSNDELSIPFSPFVYIQLFDASATPLKISIVAGGRAHRKG